MSEGIWVKSQDKRSLIYVTTFEVWKSGKVIARIGADFKWLGSYKDTYQAGIALEMVKNFIDTPLRDSDVYEMPAMEEVGDYVIQMFNAQ